MQFTFDWLGRTTSKIKYMLSRLSCRRRGCIYQTILNDFKNAQLSNFRVFVEKAILFYSIYIYIITVYLHVHELKFVEHFKWLFGNVWFLGQKNIKTPFFFKEILIVNQLFNTFFVCM